MYRMLAVRRASKSAPVWVRDALEGKRLMRAGKDYVNNDKRYDTAFELLKSAYQAAKNDSGATHTDLAKICLWAGITLNENNDITSPKVRNNRAIAWYKKGLGHARSASIARDEAIIPVKASLYNSLGVAHHHRDIRSIPTVSFMNYRKSRDIVIEYGEDPRYHKQLARVMRKIESNSGHQILRTGDQMRDTSRDHQHAGGASCLGNCA